MEIKQSDILKPNNFRLKIYKAATQHLASFIDNLKDAGAKLELEKWDNEMEEQNRREGLSK